MNKLQLMTLLILGIILVSSCGIKGPPLPPIETIGEKANNANMPEPKGEVPVEVKSSDKTKAKK
jgi:hypothetical protein